MEITKLKFMEAQGLATGHQLSNTCLSTAINRCWSSVQAHSFLQTATTSWNSMWERWLPDFQWRPVRGGFEKAVAEIQLNKSHDGASPLWIEMLVQGDEHANLSFENKWSWAIEVAGFAHENSRRRLWEIIGRLTAISRMDHMTSTAKIRKQTVWMEAIGVAKLAHRKLRWKLRKIIAQLIMTREGTEGNICCWKNWGHPGISQSLHMKVIAITTAR